jgi:hypothetical protein
MAGTPAPWRTGDLGRSVTAGGMVATTVRRRTGVRLGPGQLRPQAASSRPRLRPARGLVVALRRRFRYR